MWSLYESQPGVLQSRWCAYITVGRLHEYRWGVEDLFSREFPRDIAKLIVNYACDHPSLIFVLNGALMDINSVKIYGHIRVGDLPAFKMEFVCNFHNRIYNLGPGMDVWNLLFWGSFPDNSLWRNIKKSTIDIWLNDVDEIKSRLYKQIRGRYYSRLIIVT